MPGHMYRYQNGAFHKFKKVGFDTNVKKVKKIGYYKDGVMHQVFTSASAVSYYDGNTLLGIEEVDEGLDVLRPSIDTSKDGYTLVGWTGYGGTERFETRVATGEPMSLYALWLPNTLTVLSATLIQDGTDPKYTLVSHDSKYISEVKYAESSSWYNYAYSNSDTKTMRVKIGLYQLMTVQGKAVKNHNEGGGSINGVTSGGNTVTLTFDSDTDITMYCWDRHEWRETWSHTIAGCTDITLSNPIQWV